MIVADKYTRTTKELEEYVGWTYRHGDDICIEIETMADISIAEPKYPDSKAMKTQIRVWEKTIE